MRKNIDNAMSELIIVVGVVVVVAAALTITLGRVHNVWGQQDAYCNAVRNDSDNRGTVSPYSERVISGCGLNTETVYAESNGAIK